LVQFACNRSTLLPARRASEGCLTSPTRQRGQSYQPDVPARDVLPARRASEGCCLPRWRVGLVRHRYHCTQTALEGKRFAAGQAGEKNRPGAGDIKIELRFPGASIMATTTLATVLQQLRRCLRRQDQAGLSDGELLEGYVARRDEFAFEELVRRHGP